MLGHIQCIWKCLQLFYDAMQKWHLLCKFMAIEVLMDMLHRKILNKQQNSPPHC